MGTGSPPVAVVVTRWFKPVVVVTRSPAVVIVVRPQRGVESNATGQFTQTEIHRLRQHGIALAQRKHVSANLTTFLSFIPAMPRIYM